MIEIEELYCRDSLSWSLPEGLSSLGLFRKHSLRAEKLAGSQNPHHWVLPLDCPSALGLPIPLEGTFGIKLAVVSMVQKSFVVCSVWCVRVFVRACVRCMMYSNCRSDAQT